MMTPAQLMAYEFKSAGRNAYKADDVDAFFGEVAVNYERLYRENAELSKRMGLLADKLEQYKSDEGEIKQAVVAAQKAANLIVKEAEESVAGARSQADEIIAAAREEADAIRAEAERQAIADSELLLSISRDKAEEIIAKAKEKAHEIIIEANDTASSTVGAATRTITSESLHFDMLKKEVFDFKASILSQYKAHIELISKLPEIAAEEAKKIEGDEADTEAPVDLSSTVSETEATSADDKPLEFVDEEEVSDDETPENEEVVHTQLPYDFFAEDTSLEFVEDDEPEEEPAVTVDEFEADVEAGESDSEPADKTEDDESTPADIPISRRFSVDIGRIDYSFDSEADEEGTDEGESESEASDETEYDEEAVDSDVDDDTDDEEEDDEDDNPSPRPNSFFSMFETVDADSEDEDDDDDDGDDKPTRRGFFWRKK